MKILQIKKNFVLFTVEAKLKRVAVLMNFFIYFVDF